jgi:hypothetical protein
MCECARFLVLSEELPLEKKTKIFYFFFNLYISLSTMTNFCKVPYSEDLKSQENRKVKRSTTSIKTQGDLHPHEVSISVLTDSSVNNFVPLLHALATVFTNTKSTSSY